METVLQRISAAVKSPVPELPQRVENLATEVRKLKKELASGGRASGVSVDQLIQNAVEVGGAKVIVAEVESANPAAMRNLIDQVRQRMGETPWVCLLAGKGEDAVTLVAGAQRELTKKGVHCGNWVKEVAKVVGGGGGGRPDMAQAGGKQPDKLPEALEKAKETVTAMLS
ncbi:MAG: hypothetical protein D6741_00505 [Planctomycetota bacterium]|nr:MAG: hypothetical protein D6741_00505 [Planctomycetota bacterium]